MFSHHPWDLVDYPRIVSPYLPFGSLVFLIKLVGRNWLLIILVDYRVLGD